MFLCIVKREIEEEFDDNGRIKRRRVMQEITNVQRAEVAPQEPAPADPAPPGQDDNTEASGAQDQNPEAIQTTN